MRDMVVDIAARREAVRPVPLMEARGLVYDTAGGRLIDGVDLNVAEGRQTAIMGANGTGKSLLLRLLHGLIEPTGGEVLWRGLAPDAAARHAQAMVFQRPVMLRRSAIANLRFALNVRGVRGAERRAREAEAMERARLTHLARRPARVLSGGEQQRLAVARALACRPKLLFLDEPTASLDPASTAAVEALIGEARAEGVTVLLVTHDSGQARRLADEVIFMDGGRVAEAGPAERVLDAPRSEAAQAWLAGRIYLPSGSNT